MNVFMRQWLAHLSTGASVLPLRIPDGPGSQLAKIHSTNLSPAVPRVQLKKSLPTVCVVCFSGSLRLPHARPIPGRKSTLLFSFN